MPALASLAEFRQAVADFPVEGRREIRMLLVPASWRESARRDRSA